MDIVTQNNNTHYIIDLGDKWGLTLPFCLFTSQISMSLKLQMYFNFVFSSPNKEKKKYLVSLLVLISVLW